MSKHMLKGCQIFFTVKKDSKEQKNAVNDTNNDHCVKSNVSKDAIDLNKGRECVGVVNSIHGNKTKFVPLVHTHVRVRPTSACERDYFRGQPAIYSKKRDGVGKFKATDGSLSFYQCVLLRRKHRSVIIKSWKCSIKQNPTHALNQTCINFNVH